MSAVKKLVKGVVHFVKKYWKVIVIVALVVFTAGIATVGLAGFSSAMAAAGGGVGGFFSAVGSTMIAGVASIGGTFGIGSGVTASTAGGAFATAPAVMGATASGAAGATLLNGAAAQALGFAPAAKAGAAAAKVAMANASASGMTGAAAQQAGMTAAKAAALAAKGGASAAEAAAAGSKAVGTGVSTSTDASTGVITHGLGADATAATQTPLTESLPTLTKGGYTATNMMGAGASNYGMATAAPNALGTTATAGGATQGAATGGFLSNHSGLLMSMAGQGISSYLQAKQLNAEIDAQRPLSVWGRDVDGNGGLGPDQMGVGNPYAPPSAWTPPPMMKQGK
jgi:hypothetical protein